MLGTTLTFTSMAISRPGAAPDTTPLPVLISAIAADGWGATYPTPPAEFDPVGDAKTVSILRAGFDATGAPATAAETLRVMKRIRLPYPDQATLTADAAALSDFVYATDSVVGVTNNSTREAPAPIAVWCIPDWQVADGTVVVKLAVAHAHARNGRPVAAVVFEATDGVTTVSQTVTTMTTATYAASGLSAPLFTADLDVSTLAAGEITLNAKIRPWVGSEFDIATDADAYPSPNLSVRKAINNTGNAYGTIYAYVDAAGNDGTGVASTTAATALASPFLTFAAAMAASKVLNNSTYGRNSYDNCVIRLGAGAFTTSGAYSSATVGNGLVVEGTDPTSAMIPSGTSVMTLPQRMTLRNLIVRRGSSATASFFDGFAGAGTSRIVNYIGVEFDQGGLGASSSGWVYRPGIQYLEKCFGNNSSVVWTQGSLYKVSNTVGCDNLVSSSSHSAVACRGGIVSEIALSSVVAKAEGRFIGWNFVGTGDSGRKVASIEQVQNVGIAVVGNVFEHYGGDISPSVSIAADNNTSPITNLIFALNTVTGARTNLLYQDSGTVTVAKSGVIAFNAHENRNMKSDVFGTNANLVGNWPMIFRVGGLAEFTKTGSINGDIPYPGSWIGEVAALGDVNGTDAAPLAPDWTLDASWVGTQAGGGDYTPGAATDLPTIPAGRAPYPVDQLGRAIANDGSARVGALQAVA